MNFSRFLKLCIPRSALFESVFSKLEWVPKHLIQQMAMMNLYLADDDDGDNYKCR